MKFLSLTKTEVITILLGILESCLELLCFLTLIFIIPFLFVKLSLGMIIYAVLWLIIAFYESFMPDRYWKWYVKGFNKFKVLMSIRLIILGYTAFIIHVYGDEMINYYLKETCDYKVEEVES